MKYTVRYTCTLWYSSDLDVDPFRPQSIRLVIGLDLGLFWPQFVLVFFEEPGNTVLLLLLMARRRLALLSAE